MAEQLLKVALNIITVTPSPFLLSLSRICLLYHHYQTLWGKVSLVTQRNDKGNPAGNPARPLVYIWIQQHLMWWF